jgi:hypothetical protein
VSSNKKSKNHIQFEDILNLHDVIDIKNGGNVICHGGENKGEEEVCQIKPQITHEKFFIRFRFSLNLIFLDFFLSTF